MKTYWIYRTRSGGVDIIMQEVDQGINYYIYCWLCKKFHTSCIDFNLKFYKQISEDEFVALLVAKKLNPHA